MIFLKIFLKLILIQQSKYKYLKVINKIYKDTENSMKKCINKFKYNLNKIRTGRASPNLLDGIIISYYEKKLPLRKLANIIIKDACTLKVIVYDTNILKLIKKNILISDLGINPIIENNTTILLPLPPLTKERREKLIKIVKHEAEISRISIRNIRRESNNKIKFLLKKKIISKDCYRYSQENIQKITKIYIQKIDNLLFEKEKELTKI